MGAPSLLIVRLGAIGDVIHGLPAAALLRRRRPEIRLGWLVEPGAAPLLRGNPLLDAVLVWPRKQWRREGLGSFWRRSRAFFRDEVRAGGWDQALDLQGLLKSGAATLLSGAPDRIGFAGPDSREGNFLFMTRRAEPPASLRHVIERNVFLAASAIRDGETLSLAREKPPDAFREFVRDLTLNPPLPPLEAQEKRVAAWLPEAGSRPLIVLNPGGAWASKRWPAERFGQLAQLLAIEEPEPLFVIARGPGEEEMAASIRREAPAARFVDLPVLDLLELAALCRRASLFVAGDTGPLHLAAALETPCLALYSGSDPARNGPCAAAARIIDAQADAPRRVHYRQDKIGLSTIHPTVVADAARELLAKRPT
jgi:heptosyltransferase-1